MSLSLSRTASVTLNTVSYTHLLGGKRGTLSVLVFILLGAIGVPVFAGFSGGIGVLAGTTGGYIIGFLFSALVMWAMEKLPGKKAVMQIVSMIVGLIAVSYTHLDVYKRQEWRQ